jgi:pimeloyl-ACP methyl ester carboxylesterase
MKKIFGLITAYFVLCGVVPSCVGIADRFVLWPQPSVGAPPPAVRVFAGEPRIELWQVPLDEPKAFILRFYGNADLADRWVASEANSYADLGIEFWATNYPGYGQSDGPATLAGVGRAALTAFDTVKQRAGDRPIVVMGTSLGTTAALHVTAQRPATGVVLINPPALKEMIMGEFGWWNLWILASRVRGQIPDALDSIANARASKCPLLQISSMRDSVVGITYQQQVFAAYAGEKSILTRPDADHNTPLEPDVRENTHAAVQRMVTPKR